MFKFITEKPLWFNVIAGAVVALILFALFLFSLGWITGHGNASAVPSIAGKSFEEAKAILNKAGFDYEVGDSVFVDTLAPLTVVKQLPDADEVVKSNRTVVLILRSVEPPLVEMPNLIGYSFRNAEVVLHSMDLKIGDTLFRPDFARNAVLEQRMGGVKIAPGTKIRKGSSISLVLGDGVGSDNFPVPSLIGMNYLEAKALLDSNGLSIGAVVLSGSLKDTAAGFIYRQSPQRYDEDKALQHIRSGQLIDLWLQVDRPAIDTAQ